MRKHVAFGVTAIVFGFLFSLTLAEWLWLLLAVFLSGWQKLSTQF